MKTLLEDDSHSEDNDDRADLVPLIDCVFLVLLFYVVASTFSEESPFTLELPRAAEDEQSTALAPGGETATVWVNAAGEIALNQDIIPPLMLTGKLGEMTRAGMKTLVVRGDKNAPYDRVVAVVDAAQAVGVSELTLAVERKSETQP